MTVSEIFSHFGFRSEVAERETYNFNLGRGVIFSIVRRTYIFYVEIEKMSRQKDVDKNRRSLVEIMNAFGLKSITKESDFNKLCDKLSKRSNWKFTGSAPDLNRLKKLLKKYE